MRLVGLSIVMFVGSLFHVQAATGYSKTFIQCMNEAKGIPEASEKCLKKENKDHNKLLKKNYKKYLKANPVRADLIKSDHRAWQKKRDQQCQFSTMGKYAKVQTAECKLAMTIAQSNRYDSRSFVPAKK
jgi:uncharacterized protein YecT (DUF1311 family)